MKRLDEMKWEYFVIEQLFEVSIGKSIDGNKADRNGKTAYITRKETNNGLDGFITAKKEFLQDAFPVITIGNETAKPFVQVFPFYTGTKVNIMQPREKVSAYALMFVATCLEQHKNTFSYSFTINSTRLKSLHIKLPVSARHKPDYAYMENYMRDKERHALENYKIYLEKQIRSSKPCDCLSSKGWKEFFLEDIFTFEKGNQNAMNNLSEGKIPLISAKKIENGLKGFFKQNSKKLYNGHCITLNLDGDGGAGIAYYQHSRMALDSHVCALYPKIRQDKYSLLFMAKSITKQGNAYGHGHSINNNRLRVFKIMLPVKSDNEPDYEFMSSYMKNVECRQLQEYINAKLVDL